MAGHKASCDRGANNTSARLSAGPRREGDRAAPQKTWPQPQVRRNAQKHRGIPATAWVLILKYRDDSAVRARPAAAWQARRTL
eukprot:COSAG01_NODE_10119_length_2246_cov_16.418724_1_plen_83_part_00